MKLLGSFFLGVLAIIAGYGVVNAELLTSQDAYLLGITVGTLNGAVFLAAFILNKMSRK